MRLRTWLAAALALFPAPVSGALAGSKHDFASKSWSGGARCAVCHGSHEAGRAGADGLLWNHTATTAVYALYANSTLKSSVPQPNGTSRMCLSCHDGTLPADAFGGKTGGLAWAPSIGTDLSRVHPLSIVYNDALAASTNHLRAPSSSPSGLGGTIASDLLSGGKMQCTSCHDVHNRKNNGELLWKSQSLCLTCHTRQPPGSISHGTW